MTCFLTLEIGFKNKKSNLYFAEKHKFMLCTELILFAREPPFNIGPSFQSEFGHIFLYDLSPCGMVLSARKAHRKSQNLVTLGKVCQKTP